MSSPSRVAPRRCALPEASRQRSRRGRRRLARVHGPLRPHRTEALPFCTVLYTVTHESHAEEHRSERRGEEKMRSLVLDSFASAHTAVGSTLADVQLHCTATEVTIKSFFHSLRGSLLSAIQSAQPASAARSVCFVVEFAFGSVRFGSAAASRQALISSRPPRRIYWAAYYIIRHF